MTILICLLLAAITAGGEPVKKSGPKTPLLARPCPQQPSLPDIVSMEGMSDESWFWGAGDSALVGRGLQEMLKPSEIRRILVLYNNTSAPADLHISAIMRIVETGPVLAASWFKDKDGILRPAREGRHFFSALFEMKDGSFVGLLMASSHLRIVTPEGCGIVERK